MESSHGITCECGQTFKTSEKHTKHIAIQEVLKEVNRIGGEKFHEIAKKWEEDAHSGDLEEFAASHNLELQPRNATKIAKKEIIHIVRHHEQYLTSGYDDSKGGNK